MPVKKPPESAAAQVPATVLDWFQQFLKHLEINFVDIGQHLSNESDEADYRVAAMRAVKLTLSDSGMDDKSLLELIGRVVIDGSTPDDGARWTAEMNQRRFELIDRDIQGTLTPAEQIELAGLTHRMREHVDSEVNLPITGAKKIHRLLLGLGSAETGQ